MKNYTIASAGIAYEFFEDETVIVNMPVGHYYSLRHTAHDLIQLLPNGTNEKDAANMLQHKYGLDDSEAFKESRLFFEKLKAVNLLAETTDFTPYTAEVEIKAPFVSPVIETFDDMEELLKLDPVHDVDTVQGWPLKK